MNDRRHDFSTAAEIKAALDVQREFGFEPAYSYLCGKGIDSDVAIGLLNSSKERRRVHEKNGAIE